MYPLLPDHPPVEELQDIVQETFMASFKKLGKIFNLNRKADMRLINFVFNKVGDKGRKHIKQYPESFCNVALPFDKENYASSYNFTQCPNAEFAKKHGQLHVLPLFCNSDFYGIGLIHGTLIRCGTCGSSDKCDYCVVGSESPMAQKYELVKDEMGFFVSRENHKYIQKADKCFIPTGCDRPWRTHLSAVLLYHIAGEKSSVFGSAFPDKIV